MTELDPAGRNQTWSLSSSGSCCSTRVQVLSALTGHRNVLARGMSPWEGVHCHHSLSLSSGSCGSLVSTKICPTRVLGRKNLPWFSRDCLETSLFPALEAPGCLDSVTGTQIPQGSWLCSLPASTALPRQGKAAGSWYRGPSQGWGGVS